MLEKNNNSLTGILLMALTAFLWSIAGLFIKIIDWNPFNIAFGRSLIASLFILVTVRNIRFKLSFPLIAAGVANALTMILFVTANKTTTAANAIVLQYIAPVITSILSYFFLKEKVGRENLISVVLIITGIVIMFADKLNSGTWFGNIIALLSAFTFSAYFIFMRLQKDGSTIESVLLSHIITVVICLTISFILPAPKITVNSFLAICVLGIFQIGITSVLFAIAIKKISAVTGNLIAVIEPVFNPIWVFIVLGEKPQINTIIGGIIIIISITIASFFSARRENRMVAESVIN